MSATQRVKQGFLRLPMAKKLLLIASFTLMLSTVLPWYDNQNTFGSGETYQGIEGPLFAIGFLVLGLGAANFLNMFLPLFGKNFGKMRKNSGILSAALGAQSALLLLVGNTVFFHSAFGENVSHKATGSGMTLAFVSIGTLLISGWWANRKEKSGDYEKLAKEIEAAEAAIEAEREAERIAIEQQEAEVERRRQEMQAQEARAFQTQPMQQHSYQPIQAVPAPQPSVQEYQPVRPEPTPTSNVDPLTMDAKTRYKLMRQRMRQSEKAQGNYWGAKPANQPYGATRRESRLP